MDRKWMDGRTPNEATAGLRGYSVTLRDFPGTDEEIGTTFPCMRGEESRSNRPVCAGDLSQESWDNEWEEPGSLGSDRWRTSFGRDLGDLADALSLGRDPSYLHAVALSFFTHVMHGCLASHFFRIE